jgi:hypothetical protein
MFGIESSRNAPSAPPVRAGFSASDRGMFRVGGSRKASSAPPVRAGFSGVCFHRFPLPFQDVPYGALEAIGRRNPTRTSSVSPDRLIRPGYPCLSKSSSRVGLPIVQHSPWRAGFGNSMHMVGPDMQSVEEPTPRLAYSHDRIADQRSRLRGRKHKRALSHPASSVLLEADAGKNKATLAVAHVVEASPAIARQMRAVAGESYDDYHGR